MNKLIKYNPQPSLGLRVQLIQLYFNKLSICGHFLVLSLVHICFCPVPIHRHFFTTRLKFSRAVWNLIQSEKHVRIPHSSVLKKQSPTVGDGRIRWKLLTMSDFLLPSSHLFRLSTVWFFRWKRGRLLNSKPCHLYYINWYVFILIRQLYFLS